MGIVDRIRAFFDVQPVPEPEWLTLSSPSGWPVEYLSGTSTDRAMKVATVNACVEIRSDSVGKMPFFVMNRNTHERERAHYLDYLLSVRPNSYMTPYVFKKLVETWRLMRGNAYIFISKDSATGRPQELIPLNPDRVMLGFRKDSSLVYYYRGNDSKELEIDADEIIHLKAFSNDGIIGQSVLERASDTVRTASEQQRYEGTFYSNNASPSGVVQVDSSLSREAKEKFREHWSKTYGGATNAFKVAVLDEGMDYKPISMSPRDSQFVESKEISVADIARFFLVPLYKLQAGKQTYQSNEQNSIDYVTTALSPTITQYEEEFTYKALFDHEVREGIEVRINMNAELRGDTTSRANWYRIMVQLGAYSPNDVRAYEDLPAVEGGDIRIAPLNSIPLEQMGRYFETLMAARHADINEAEEEGSEEL